MDLALFECRSPASLCAAAALLTERNATVQRLLLNANDVDEEGARTLARALGAAASLRELVLRGNRVGDDGAEALAEALADNPPLRVLDPGRNGVRERGACALAAALGRNTRLRALRVDQNAPGRGGHAALAEAAARSGTLAFLDADLPRDLVGGVHAAARRNRAAHRAGRAQRAALEGDPDAALPWLIPDLVRVVAAYAGDAPGETELW